MKDLTRFSALCAAALCLLSSGGTQARMSGGQVGVIAPECDPEACRRLLASAMERVTLAGVNPAGDYRPALLREWHEQYWHLLNQLAGLEKLPGRPEQALDPHALVYREDRNPLGVVVRRSEALLNHLARQPNASGLDPLRRDLDALRKAAAAGANGPALTDKELEGLFFAACAVRRKLALSNPILDFEELLFVARGVHNGSRAHGQRPTSDGQGQHFATQYFGCNAIPGGGLYVAANFKSNGPPTIRNLLARKVVENGRLQGQPLTPGAFLSPELSYDSRELWFAYTQNRRHEWRWTDETVFHLFKINLDGTGLRQMTDGPANDFDPVCLPNGRIAFISERRGGYIRCFGAAFVNEFGGVRNHVLHSMKPDGSDIYPLSYFETSEWHPSVNHDGMIVYTRWDYVDRENCLGGNFWIKNPDGRDPRAPHGNYPQPWHTLGLDLPVGVLATERQDPLASPRDFPQALAGFDARARAPQQPHPDGRLGRPYTEMNIRAIPDSHRYLATAAPHHGESFGSLVMLDLQVPDDGFMSQVRRITPFVPFPESEAGARLQYPYGTAWPLSEDFYLVNCWENIYLLDRFGNQVLLVENSRVFGGETNWDMRLIDPIPVRSRPLPPVLPTLTNKGADADPAAPPATIGVINVYDSHLPFPPNTKIKHLRVLQNVLKSNPAMDTPQNMGYHWENTPRIPLGIVPVEQDGSAYFEAPVERELIFQALDENFMAVQTMRSVTYAHPGEQMTCLGCHENRQQTPQATVEPPLALRRQPSRLEPELSDPVEPVTFYRLVEPVFEQACVPCHIDRNVEPRNMSFDALRPYVAHFSGGMRGNVVQRDSGGSRAIPGRSGAMASRMGRALLDATHRNAVSPGNYRRIVLWLDSNAMRLGAFHDEARQMNGELVWPLLDVDSANPQGLERPRLPGNRPMQGPFGPALFTATGRFGRALNAARRGMVVENCNSYRTRPLTLEVWAKLDDATGFNILTASDTKPSAAHWELYTYRGQGDLSVYLPGQGGEVRSGVFVCDGKWHHLAMILEESRVRLYVDGNQVADRRLPETQGSVLCGDLAIGRLVEGGPGCNGLINQVRLSGGIRGISAASAVCLKQAEGTLGLWTFEH